MSAGGSVDGRIGGGAILRLAARRLRRLGRGAAGRGLVLLQVRRVGVEQGGQALVQQRAGGAGMRSGASLQRFHETEAHGIHAVGAALAPSVQAQAGGAARQGGAPAGGSAWALADSSTGALKAWRS